MSKVLTVTELADIVKRLLEPGGEEYIDEAQTFGHFVEDIAEVVSNYCGGDIGAASFCKDDNLGWAIAFHVNDSVPPDGGVYAKYDTDVTWLNGEETC